MKRALTILLFLSLAAHVRCETRVLAPATPEGLVGVWEALIPDGGSMASGVFVMVVSPQGDAKLIEMYSLIGGGVSSHFFGSAPSLQLQDGKLKIHFAAHPNQQQWCDWVEIEGSASVDGDLGAIIGKMTMHFADDLAKPETGPVQFRKGRWFSELAAAASAAERTIHSPQFTNGRAGPDKREGSH